MSLTIVLKFSSTPGGLVKTQTAGPTLNKVPDLVGLVWGLRICISSNSQIILIPMVWCHSTIQYKLLVRKAIAMMASVSWAHEEHLA
jgi:hypothetical protein